MSELAQDLANKLGLKGRKAYISPQTETTATEGESLGESSPPTGEVGAIIAVLRHILTDRMRPCLIFVPSVFKMSSNGLESLGDIGPGVMTNLWI